MNKPLISCPLEARPYHHGDLRRALILAAERVLERDGPQALSLRACRNSWSAEAWTATARKALKATMNDERIVEITALLEHSRAGES